MNIRQYLDNPMGKGAIIPGKQMIVDDLNKRYKSLTSNKSIECKIYNSKEIYYFHLTNICYLFFQYSFYNCKYLYSQ